MNRLQYSYALCIASISCLAACGGCENNEPPPATQAPIQLVEVEPFEVVASEVASQEGCRIDADCLTGAYCFQELCAFECDADNACAQGTCNERGRCDDSTPTIVLGVTTKGIIPTNFAVADGQSTQEIRIAFEGELPDEVLFRYTRDDDPEAGRQLFRADVQGQEVVFTLPTGLANPEAEDARSVRIDLSSSLGSWSFSFAPDVEISGQYSGAASMQTFGSTGLPLLFEIVTKPEDASLQSAEKAWLVLPVREDLIFSPTRGEDAPEAVHSELVFDDFTKSWVATFESAFVNDDSNIISFNKKDQIGRQMRFELTQVGTQEIFGFIRDRWTGLYDERSSDGVISPAAVAFEGRFSVRRDAPARALNELDLTQQLTAPDSQLQLNPSLDVCAPVSFAVSPYIGEGVTYDCAGISTLEDFRAASPENQGTCAIALAYDGLSSDATTTSQIQGYLNGTTTDTRSFEEFMEECAAGTDGLCRPSPQVLCAREALSISYREQVQNSPLSDPLLEAYTEVTREAFLGRQFGAYQSDVETRLTWLKTSDYPPVATNALRELNEQLLEDWKANVMDVHHEVLSGQFDVAGLGVLARVPDDQDAQEKRLDLLMDMSQSFRNTLNSLSLSAQRWDALLLNAEDRKEKAKYVSSKTRDLYLLAGVLKNLNRAGGAGFLSGGIGSGFALLSRELARLNQSFNTLIYARDAEVVVSTSVDPTVTNLTLLGELEDQAMDEIGNAASSVTAVIDEDQVRALTETQLRNKLNNDISSVRNELVELCGLPVSCSLGDLDTRPECLPRDAVGECGLVYSEPIEGSYAANSEELEAQTQSLEAIKANPSQAGQALLAQLEDIKELEIAIADLDAHTKRTSLMFSNTDAFATKVNEWDAQRSSVIDELGVSTAKLKASGAAEYGALVENIDERRLKMKESLAVKKVKVATWYSIQVQNKSIDLGVTAGFRAGRYVADRIGKGIVRAMERARRTELSAIPSSAKDPYASTRVATNARYDAITGAMSTKQKLAVRFIDAAEEAYTIQKEFKQLNKDRLSKLKEVGALEKEEDFLQLQEEYDKIAATEQGNREDLRDAMQLLRDQNKLRLASERDFSELDDRRSELLQELTKTYGLQLKIARVYVRIQQRQNEYIQVAQRAQIARARLDELDRQRTDINRIVGSPSAVFARANKVAQAESRLERAKDRLMNWLVALEYYAVRPFMDQRIQILLARNHYQLEEIAKDLKDLQNNCGGAVNTQVSELSLKSDLLRMTQPQLDLVTKETLTTDVQFRALLQRGYIPVDKRVRYTTNETLSGIVSRMDGSVLSASFDIDVEDFANLETTCNAKIRSIGIQLVGDIGEGQPTVSVLYDGTGLLRSCQPGIDAYVEQFGTQTTAFGSVTTLRSQGRSISPVAGINTFTDRLNTSLGGLPLASQYTILIDKNVGENGSFDWANLKDVRLKLEYEYQDVFPTNQCE